MSIRSNIEDVIRGKKDFYSTYPIYNSGVHENINTYIISGSFNLLHAGHLSMAAWIEKQNPEGIVIFELSLINCDKGMTGLNDAVHRITQFEKIERNWMVTTKPNFVQKSQILPGCKFVVGADTIERIDMPKYYYNSTNERDRCMKIIKKNNCGFIVVERFGKTLSGLNLSKCLMEISSNAVGYEPINISSSEIRKKNG